MKSPEGKIRQHRGWDNGARQWLTVFGMAILVASAGNLSLGPLLLASGLATLVAMALGGWRHPLFIGAGFLFIPVLLIFSRSYETLAIGSPAWQFRMGGLLVSVWISGLLYIIIATLVRYLGVTKLRRIFSSSFSGVLIVLLAIASLPRIFIYAYHEPLLASTIPPYKFVIVAIIALLAYVLTTALSKKRGTQAAYAILIALSSGLIAALLLDSVELLFLGGDSAHLLVIGTFFTDPYAGVGVTLFHNWEAYFGFWQYLHFDLESLLLMVPLVLIAVSEHMRSMTLYVETNVEGDRTAQADRTILAEGATILIGGMAAGFPLTLAPDTVATATTSKRARPLVLILFAILTILLGVFAHVPATLSLIPLPVIGGTLIGVAGYEGVKAFARIARPIHEEINPRTTALALFVFGFGFLLTSLEFASDLIGDDSFRLMIGTTPVPSFLIVIVVAFIIHLAFPRLME